MAVETGVGVSEVTDTGVVLADGRVIPGDVVVAAIGVRPDTRLAEMAGLVLGPHGGIAVDADGRTSAEDVYAVGDAVEKADSVGGGSSLIALANIANRQGRRVADVICGRSVRPALSQGTAIVKVFGLTAAMTGWSERRLRAAGQPYRVIHSHPMSHAGYYPGAEPMSLKLLFDPRDGAILGAQAVGGAGSTSGSTCWPLPWRPVSRRTRWPTWSSPTRRCSPRQGPGEHARLHGRELDVGRVRRRRDRRAGGSAGRGVGTPRRTHGARTPHRGHSGSINAPLDTLRGRIGDVGPGPFVVYCQVGQRGHTATMLLHELGVQARNLDGGT